MSLVHLSYQETKELLTAAVEARGADFVYKSYTENRSSACAYFRDDGTPSCIVGHVLAAKGIGLADLLDTDVAESVFDINTRAISYLLERGLVEVDCPATESLLRRVQWEQDCQAPWGRALTGALAATEGVPA